MPLDNGKPIMNVNTIKYAVVKSFAMLANVRGGRKEMVWRRDCKGRREEGKQAVRRIRKEKGYM